ncbi:sodium-independent sulfate anion transporter isoform X2 [Entelurus aequoreus]|uniref:sodium-independent sulfate anion transporter isoform X2 n=1 Tax=Entelurus aequoreus TaxID=161455 RepID=UPI002B1E2A0D|nr:sodium-independent sulfate anion transporter isoform X2 [Entelurus aequoreus]
MDQPLLQGDSNQRSVVFFRLLKRCLPILTWLPKYNIKCLQMDLLAGFTVGLTTVPQVLAYAEVAGLPVQYGLYSAFMGGFIYALLGTSKDVTLGPTAIMSLLCFSVVGGEPQRAVLLSLLCGIIQAGTALLRLGFLLDFVSFPVIKGFTCAAAITIGFGQVQNLLGLKDIPHEFFPQVYCTLSRIPEARIGDVVLGVLCVAVLMMLMMMVKTSVGSEDSPRYSRIAQTFVWTVATMRNALVVVAASLCAFSWEAYGHHVFTITGKTAQGLPAFKPPPTSDTSANGTVVPFKQLVQDFGGGLAVIPFMGLLESIAIAKAFGVIVLLSLAFLMPAFYYIPKACLAAVIICAVAPMLDYHVVADMWRIHKLDLLPFIVTFLMSLWQVQYGIMGGVAVSAALLMYSMARPHTQMSGEGVLLIQLSNGLSFPAAEHLSYIIHTKALQVSPARSVVLDCHHVSMIDYSVIHELSDLLRHFKVQHLHLIFSGLQPHILEVLLAANLEGFIFADSVETALQM